MHYFEGARFDGVPVHVIAEAGVAEQVIRQWTGSRGNYAFVGQVEDYRSPAVWIAADPPRWVKQAWSRQTKR